MTVPFKKYAEMRIARVGRTIVFRGLQLKHAAVCLQMHLAAARECLPASRVEDCNTGSATRSPRPDPDRSLSTRSRVEPPERPTKRPGRTIPERPRKRLTRAQFSTLPPAQPQRCRR